MNALAKTTGVLIIETIMIIVMIIFRRNTLRDVDPYNFN